MTGAAAGHFRRRLLNARHHNATILMQTATVQFELSEALVHLENLVAELRDGKVQADDAPALAVQLGHILDHMNRAWNCKDMSVKEVGALPQPEFERLSNTVPNFLGERIIGDLAVS